MSEEIKKKATDTKLTLDELEAVSGGFQIHEPDIRFSFTQEEMDKLRKGICPSCNKTFPMESLLNHFKSCCQ